MALVLLLYTFMKRDQVEVVNILMNLVVRASVLALMVPSLSFGHRILKNSIIDTTAEAYKSYEAEEKSKRKSPYPLGKVLKKIYRGEASYEDVGIDVSTSLFVYPIDLPEKNKKRILKAEAYFESYRNHPIVQKKIKKHQNSICRQFIPGIAPVRKIISNSYLANGISPNFASLMRIESQYGMWDRKKVKGKSLKEVNWDSHNYDIPVNPDLKKNCSTASGVNQILDGTRDHILKLKYGVLEPLIEDHKFRFKGVEAKVRSQNGKKHRCNPINPKVYRKDDRMFVESSSLLASSYYSYIYDRVFPYEPVKVFAGIYHGPFLFNKLSRKNRLFKKSLSRIAAKNLDKQRLSRQEKIWVKEGLDYAFYSLAVRSIITQPVQYCSGKVNYIGYFKENTDLKYEHFRVQLKEIYRLADEYIKSPKNQKKLRVFRPGGPILKHNHLFNPESPLEEILNISEHSVLAEIFKF